MSIIAEFSVTSTTLALHPSMIDVPSVTIEVTNQVSLDEQRPLLFFWAEGEELDRFESALKADATLSDVKLYTDLGEQQHFRVRVSEDVDTVVYPKLVEVGAARLETTARNGTSWNRFRFPNREALATFRQWCNDQDIDFSLQALYTEFDSTETVGKTLTNQQRESLRVAYEQGYFEIPQQVTLEEVASEMGVTAQAVSERLHRAYAALVEDHVLARDE